MAKKKITQITEDLLHDYLAEEGYMLYHTEFVKEGNDWFLRVFIDRMPGPDGEELPIGTEDCEKVSRYLSGRLDEEDPIGQNYYLEVSSPGMDRPLLKPEHYLMSVGKEVEVRLYRAKDGRKDISGVLKQYENDTVIIEDEDGKEWDLDIKEIARTRLAVIF